MRVNDIIVRKMLKDIYFKLIDNKKLNIHELNLMKSLITLTIEDLGGNLDVDDSIRREEKD